MEDKNKISKFLNAVHADAEKRREKIIKETEYNKNEGKEKIDKETAAKKAVLLEAAEEKLSQDLGRQVSAYTSECKQKLLEKRSKIKDKVFADAAAKLVEYTKGDAYLQKLLDYIEAGDRKFKEKPVTVFVKPDDMKFSKDLMRSLPMGSKVEPDDKIALGGLKMYCEQQKVILDFTFDTNLENQNDWFLQESKLLIV